MVISVGGKKTFHVLKFSSSKLELTICTNLKVIVRYKITVCRGAWNCARILIGINWIWISNTFEDAYIVELYVSVNSHGFNRTECVPE